MTHTYRLFTHYTTIPARPVLGSISGNIPRKKELTPLRTQYYCWKASASTSLPKLQRSFPYRVQRFKRLSTTTARQLLILLHQKSCQGMTDIVFYAHFERSHGSRMRGSSASSPLPSARHHLPTTQGPLYNQLARKIASFTYRGVCQSPL